MQIADMIRPIRLFTLWKSLLAACLLILATATLQVNVSAEEAQQVESLQVGEQIPSSQADEVKKQAAAVKEKATVVIESSQKEAKNKINQALKLVNKYFEKALFFDVSGGLLKRPKIDKATGQPILDKGGKVVTTSGLPFLVVFLVAGAIFFSIYHRFAALTYFKHSVDIVRGKFNKDSDTGDISSFRALTSALSATVGLGNISGVATAMLLGGPGALFWMMFLGFFGMASKFHESTLAQMYRIQNPDGSISGGPMFYLSAGIGEFGKNWKLPAKIIAIIFAMFCMGAALGGGNMYQANQAFDGFFITFVERHVDGDLGNLRTHLSYGFGIMMAVLVGSVVIGGITRIGKASSRIVPFMAVLYVLSCAAIILINFGAVPKLVADVFTEAFQWNSAVGGIIGAMMVGFQRAAFSSEAGLGSSAIAHSAAKTPEPVREGFVASLEPFIDTVVICFMTGMAVLITGAYLEKDVGGGVGITLFAFDSLGGVMPYILSVCIVLFAFSTMLSWCYYGERAWGYLFGIRTVIVFRIIFVIFILVGTVAEFGTVIAFADLMLLSMALPNIIGGVLLAGKVKTSLANYIDRLKKGDFDKEPVDFEV